MTDRHKIAALIEHGVLAVNDGYRAKNRELASTGIPFARAGNVNNGFHFEDADYFPEPDLHKVGVKISQLNDVVFTSKGTVGRFAMVRENTPRFVYSPQLCFWRVLDPNRLDSRFLYYWMHGYDCREQFDRVKGQTDMADYVSLRDQRNMSITLPPIDHQRLIGRVLISLDERIELNRETNRTLEATAQAIFKSWFVDFDPVVAKSEGRRPFGMNAKTAAFFSNLFEETVVGTLPCGWTVTTLPQLGEVNRGRSRHRPRHAPHLYGGPYPFIQTGDIKASGGRITSYNQSYSEAGLAQSRLWPAGTMCITIAATIAETGVLTFPACFPDSVVGFIPDTTKCDVYVVEYTFRQLKRQIQHEASGSVQDNINMATIDQTRFPFPPKPLQDAFLKVFRPINDRIVANCHEIQELARLRDWLLPRLLSGELRGKTAEKMLAEVT